MRRFFQKTMPIAILGLLLAIGTSFGIREWIRWRVVVEVNPLKEEVETPPVLSKLEAIQNDHRAQVIPNSFASKVSELSWVIPPGADLKQIEFWFGSFENSIRSPLVDELLRYDSHERLSNPSMRMFDSALIPQQPCFTQLIDACERPIGRHAIAFEIHSGYQAWPHLRKCCSVADLCKLDLIRYAQQGDRAGVGARIRVMERLADSIRDEPFSRSQIAHLEILETYIEAITRAYAFEVDTEGNAKDLIQSLLKRAEFPYYRMGAIGDRAEYAAWYQALRDGVVPIKRIQRAYFNTKGVTEFEGEVIPIPAYSEAEHAVAMSQCDEAVSLADWPTWERATISLAQGQARVSEKPHPPLGFLDSCHRLSYLEPPLIARLRALAVLIAAEQYRREQGTWPENIPVLVPKYLPEIPLDPMSGQPMIIRHLQGRLSVEGVKPWEKLLKGGKANLLSHDALVAYESAFPDPDLRQPDRERLPMPREAPSTMKLPQP